MVKITKSVTQQTRARKEFKAIERAEKKNVTEKEVIVEMTKAMVNPDSAETLQQASSALLYMKAVKNGETPITDAVNSCLERKKKEGTDSTVNKPKSSVATC